MKTWKDVWMAMPGPESKKEYLFLYMKAFAMGTADLVPGVSGGTIAFITGIYDQLLESVAALNSDLIKKLLKFDIKGALSMMHLRFLIPLSVGILSAMLLLARLMHYLLNEHKVLTWAAFFGLISASIVIVYRHQDKPKDPFNIFMLLIGTAVGYIMVSLIPVTTPDAYWFYYLCGIIGITAMILPGLSGSFLLLILGKYEQMTSAIKNPLILDNFIVMLIFFAGTLTGLLSFSKILNWLMKKYRSQTMAFLSGLLIGSIKKVWPWKTTLESTIVRGKEKILREANYFPSNWETQEFIALGLIVIGFFAVLFVEYYSEDKKSGVSSAG